MSLLCGRDAAERTLNWDYADPNAVSAMLRQFDLLVAARDGRLDALPNVSHAIGHLPLPENSIMFPLPRCARG